MKKMTLKKDLCSGILAVLVGVFLRMILPYSIKSRVNTVTSAMGPACLPKLMIYGTILCGICLLLTGLVLKRDETLEIETGREGHVVLYFVLLLLYMLAMKYVGFLIAFVISPAVSMWMMEGRNWRHYPPMEFPVIVIFVSSKYGLHVTLPTIILQGGVRIDSVHFK